MVLKKRRGGFKTHPYICETNHSRNAAWKVYQKPTFSVILNEVKNLSAIMQIFNIRYNRQPVAYRFFAALRMTKAMTIINNVALQAIYRGKPDKTIYFQNFMRC